MVGFGPFGFTKIEQIKEMISEQLSYNLDKK